jgi:hypothetical protein
MIETTQRDDPVPWPPAEPVAHARPALSTVCSLLAILSAAPLALVVMADRLSPLLPRLVADVGLPGDVNQLSRLLLVAGAAAALTAPPAAWLARVLPPWVVLLTGLLAVTFGYWRAEHAGSLGEITMVRVAHGIGAGCLLVATAALVGAATARTRPLLAGGWAAAVVGTAALGPRLARTGLGPQTNWHDRLQPYPWLLALAAVSGLALAAASVADRRPRLFPRWIDLAALLPLAAAVPSALVALTEPGLPGSAAVLAIVILLGVLLGIAAVALALSRLGGAVLPLGSPPAAPDPGGPPAAPAAPAGPGASAGAAAAGAGAVPVGAGPVDGGPGDGVAGAAGSAAGGPGGTAAGAASAVGGPGRGAVGAATAAVAFVTAAAVGPTLAGWVVVRAYARAAQGPAVFPRGSGGLLIAAAVAGVLAAAVGAWLPEPRRRATILSGLLAAAAGALALLPATASIPPSVPGALLLGGGSGLALGAQLRWVGPLATVVAGALVTVALPLGEVARGALQGWRSQATLQAAAGPDAITRYLADLKHSAVVAQRLWLLLVAVLLLAGAAVVALALGITRSRSAAHSR